VRVGWVARDASMQPTSARWPLLDSGHVPRQPVFDIACGGVSKYG
jgi:hypothetical protein